MSTEMFNLLPITPSESSYVYYDDLVKSMNCEVLVWVTVGDYQGDYFWLLRSNVTAQYGFLTNGYGSCSSCDALESVTGLGDKVLNPAVYELRDSLYNDIRWFETATDVLKFLVEHDWKGNYYAKAQEPFSEAVIEYFEKNK